jgi:nicotinic acid mononucleotide adenylyltransferase
MTLANLIVVTRPGVEFSAANVGGAVAEQVVDLRGQTSGSAPPTVERGNRIFVTDVVAMDVSATRIRQAARENRREDLDRLVPLEVAHYIRKYRLYRNKNEA